MKIILVQTLKAAQRISEVGLKPAAKTESPVLPAGRILPPVCGYKPSFSPTHSPIPLPIICGGFPATKEEWRSHYREQGTPQTENI